MGLAWGWCGFLEAEGGGSFISFGTQRASLLPKRHPGDPGELLPSRKAGPPCSWSPHWALAGRLLLVARGSHPQGRGFSGLQSLYSPLPSFTHFLAKSLMTRQEGVLGRELGTRTGPTHSDWRTTPVLWARSPGPIGLWWLWCPWHGRVAGIFTDLDGIHCGVGRRGLAFIYFFHLRLCPGFFGLPCGKECAGDFQSLCLSGHLPLVGWAAGRLSCFSHMEGGKGGRKVTPGGRAVLPGTPTPPHDSEACRGFAGLQSWGRGSGHLGTDLRQPEEPGRSWGLGTAASELGLLPTGREA